jgi:UDP-N-acetylmuramoyl-tripeptide--D-alanyl-D-alanine ligase
LIEDLGLKFNTETNTASSHVVSSKLLNAISSLLQKELSIRRIVQNHGLAGLNDLFLAIKGNTNDGRLFIKEALEAGAYAVCDTLNLGDIQLPQSDRLFLIPDMTDFLRETILETCNSFKNAGTKLIAITGSSGKTTTKMWMAELLKKQFPLMHSIPEEYLNYNAELTGALLFLSTIPDNTPAIVMEIGVAKPGDMSLIASLLKPNLAIVTNVGRAHLAAFSDREALIREKLLLCDYSEKCVIHQNLAPYRKASAYFSLPEEIGKDRPIEAVLTLSETESASVTSPKNIHIRLEHVFQPHALENISAILIGLSLLFPTIDFTIGLKDLRFPKGRGNFFEIEFSGKRLQIFDSSYNANSGKNGSMYRELQALERLASRGASVGAILGEMLELGAESEQLHTEIRDYALSITPKICFVGNWPLQNIAADTMLHHPDRLTAENLETFMIQAFQLFDDGDLILIKGSNGIKLYDFLIPAILKFRR